MGRSSTRRRSEPCTRQSSPDWPPISVKGFEVADTSLAYDLGTKVPLYARHGIPEAWVIDAATRRTRVFRQPFGRGEASRSAGSGYATEVSIEPHEAISSASVVDDAGEQVVVELARLLPTVG